MPPNDAAESVPDAAQPLKSSTATVVHHDSRDSCVTIRNIGPTDASAYIELLHRIDAESRFLAWEPGERPLGIEVIRTRINHADPSTRLHLLATHGDQLVGSLVSHRATLRRVRHRADFTIAVLRRFHRHGIGSQLLDALHAWAAAQHIKRVELTVMSHNTAAIALYHRAGYHQEGIKRESIRIDDQPIDEIMMARTITPPNNVSAEKSRCGDGVLSTQGRSGINRVTRSPSPSASRTSAQSSTTSCSTEHDRPSSERPGRERHGDDDTWDPARPTAPSHPSGRIRPSSTSRGSTPAWPMAAAGLPPRQVSRSTDLTIEPHRRWAAEEGDWHGG